VLCAWKSFTSPSGFSTLTLAVARYHWGSSAVTTSVVAMTSPMTSAIRTQRILRTLNRSAREALSFEPEDDAMGSFGIATVRATRANGVRR